MYKKILVPIDFSSESAAAVDSAILLAKSSDSEVYLLNVIEDSYSKPLKSIGISRQSENNLILGDLKNGIENKLRIMVEKINRNGTNTHFEVRIGNVFQSILEYLNEIDADLIVMGSKGLSEIDEVLVGSVTEKVVKYVHCPVITVKEKSDLSEIKSILYPTDLREEQETVLKDIKALQDRNGAHIHIVKVFESDFVNKAHIEERMKKFAEYFNLKDYSVTALEHPDEAEAILQFAKLNDVTMIAMATHYRKGLEILFNTRISKNVVENAKRPIWTKRVN